MERHAQSPIRKQNDDSTRLLPSFCLQTGLSLLSRKVSEESLGRDEMLRQTSHKQCNYHHHYIHFEISGDLCNLIGSQQSDLFTNHTIFCCKSHLPSQWERNTKTKHPDLKAC